MAKNRVTCFVVKNNLNKIINLDINGIPLIEPNAIVDLLDYASIEELEKSKTLNILLSQQFLSHIDDPEEDEDTDEIFKTVSELIANEDRRMSYDPEDDNEESELDEDYELDEGNEDNEEDENTEYIMDEDGKILLEYMPTFVIDQLSRINTESKNKTSPVSLSLNFQDIESNDCVEKILKEIQRVKKSYGFSIKNIILEFKS